MFVHMICCMSYKVYTQILYNEKIVEYTKTTIKDANEIEKEQ